MRARREFPKDVRIAAFRRANGRCEGRCGGRLYVGKYHYDHVISDALGGEPILENCRVLCIACHGEKTSHQDVPRIAKADRQLASFAGIKARSTRPLPGSKDSGWRRPFNGPAVRRHP